MDPEPPSTLLHLWLGLEPPFHSQPVERPCLSFRQEVSQAVSAELEARPFSWCQASQLEADHDTFSGCPHCDISRTVSWRLCRRHVGESSYRLLDPFVSCLAELLVCPKGFEEAGDLGRC